jgi:hypothetical protein
LVVRADLVITVREQKERADLPQPAAEEGQHVQRGLVGPVQILDHHHRPYALARPAERIEQGLEDLRAPARRHAFPQGAADLPGDVVQRTERARREQRIATAPEHLGAHPGPVGERRGQRRLARAGLAADHRDVSTVRAGGQQFVQVGQRFGAFQQVHRCRC